MRNLKKLTLVACLLLVCGSTAFAQKFGCINSQVLIESMPDYTTAMENYQAFNTNLQEQLDILTEEYSKKYQEYSASAATLAASVRELKERELGEIQNRIEQFQYNAQQDAQAKYRELMEPVIDKAQEAIDKVAKANGFAAIFDLSTGSTPYVDETIITDILGMVKSELGIAG